VTPIARRPQSLGSFAAGDPDSGYYNDLTIKATDSGSPRGCAELALRLTHERRRANPVTIAQLGLGAWQLSLQDPTWLDAVDVVVRWIERELEPDGTIPYHFDMPHTFQLAAPWPSAMAQGEAASLLVRASGSLGRPEVRDLARRAIEPLLRSGSRLVSSTRDGPVLQEYPTTPPAHVLNGWIFGLWGLYDVGISQDDSSAMNAFTVGTETLAARLPLYSVRWSWSRYDLYPHRVVHVTSPFYHRLHVAQLRAMARITTDRSFSLVADEWEAGLRNPVAFGVALIRKLSFRALVPRKALP
jgi:hypothetical protein